MSPEDLTVIYLRRVYPIRVEGPWDRRFVLVQQVATVRADRPLIWG